MEKKEKIIQAAMQLLTDNGVQATPMSAIANAAGTGMGTIYNYFATKEELINAIYLYIKEDETRKLTTPAADASIKHGFDRFYETLIRYFIAHPLHYRFMDQFSNSPIITTATKEEGGKIMETIVALMAKGQEQGILKEIPLNELFHFLHGGLMGFVRWVVTEKIPITKNLLDHQLRMAWDTVKQ